MDLNQGAPDHGSVAPLRLAWQAALGLFVLAGLTGALFRGAVALGWQSGDMAGLSLGNIRHAHSHLMYMGWVTPALMALVAHAVERRTGRSLPGIRPILGLVLGLALLAYPPFLLWGYAPAELGTVRLPLSVIGAGLNVLGWYAFVWAYVRGTRGIGRDAALRLFDWALFFLFLSTLGAWGLPLAQALGIGAGPLKAALTHLFLDTFSEGWFVLGVLGLAYGAASGGGPLWPLRLALGGIPFLFALALPDGYVPSLLKGLAAVGAAAVGVGLLAAAALLWRRFGEHPLRWVWRLALVLLAFKAAGQLGVAAAPHANWVTFLGLRLLYLHLMLLGFVTLGLFAAAESAFDTSGRAGLVAMAAAVCLLLATLLPLTPLWPAALAGRWVVYALALAAWPPALAGGYVLCRRSGGAGQAKNQGGLA